MVPSGAMNAAKLPCPLHDEIGILQYKHPSCSIKQIPKTCPLTHRSHHFCILPTLRTINQASCQATKSFKGCCATVCFSNPDTLYNVGP